MNDADELDYTRYVTARMAWMRNVAYLLCGDWHRADDICQTTLTRLYVHWHRARAATNLDAYVRTMIVRVFLGERRSAWSRRVSLVEQIPEDLRHGIVAMGPPRDPDRDELLAVRAALAEVAPRQRVALVLRFFCDLSLEETAKELRCSIGAVKSLTSRGLDALRTVLGPGEAMMEGFDGGTGARVATPVGRHRATIHKH